MLDLLTVCGCGSEPTTFSKTYITQTCRQRMDPHWFTVCGAVDLCKTIAAPWLPEYTAVIVDIPDKMQRKCDILKNFGSSASGHGNRPNWQPLLARDNYSMGIQPWDTYRWVPHPLLKLVFSWPSPPLRKSNFFESVIVALKRSGVREFLRNTQKESGGSPGDWDSRGSPDNRGMGFSP